MSSGYIMYLVSLLEIVEDVLLLREDGVVGLQIVLTQQFLKKSVYLKYILLFFIYNININIITQATAGFTKTKTSRGGNLRGKRAPKYLPYFH